MESLFPFLVMQAFVCAFFSAYVAGEKNRNAYTWFVLGFLFSFYALIAVAGVPGLPPRLPAAGNERRRLEGPSADVYEQRRREARELAARSGTFPAETGEVGDDLTSDMYWLGRLARQLLVRWPYQTFSVLMLIGVGFAASASGGSLLGFLWAAALNPLIWLAAYVYRQASRSG